MGQQEVLEVHIFSVLSWTKILSSIDVPYLKNYRQQKSSQHDPESHSVMPPELPFLSRVHENRKTWLKLRKKKEFKSNPDNNYITY